MNNFKYPQYLTANGFARSAKKPKARPLGYAAAKQQSPAFLSEAGTNLQTLKEAAPSRMRILAEKRVLAKRIIERRQKGISDEAAKMIAEALSSMIHSK